MSFFERDYIFGMAPSLDASDHQDHYMFRIGDSELNLHFPLLQGGGHIQIISSYIIPGKWDCLYEIPPEGVRGVWILREEYWFHENRPSNSVFLGCWCLEGTSCQGIC